MMSFLKNTSESVTTDLSISFDPIPQLVEEYQVLQNITNILTQIKIARDDLFNILKNLFTITDLDRQKDTVLDTLIFVLWGVAANRGDLGLSGINFYPKPPYLYLDGKFDELPPIYRQYFDSLQRFFKVLFEDFWGLRARIDEFEKLKNTYSSMMDTVKEKVKDSRIGILDRMGIATKALSNSGKLKMNSEALKQIELKVIREVYMAKTIISNSGNLLASCLDIGMKMRNDNHPKKVPPNEGKKYYPVALQVVKNYVNTSAVFVEGPFKQ